MVELWVRPIVYNEKLDQLFPLKLARWEPPIADAVEDAEGLALALSRQSTHLHFEIEIGTPTGTWIRYTKGRKETFAK